MWQSYFILTLRKLQKHPLYALTNLLGLSVGIACFAVLSLLALHESTYDNFHPASDRTFRVVEYIEQGGVGEKSASLPFPAADALQCNYADKIEKSVRLFNYQSPSLSVVCGNKVYNEKKFYFADSTFFEVFGFNLLKGNVVEALASPNQVIISQEAALRYFGNENPMGKQILFFGIKALTISGVANVPTRGSHFRFDFVASMTSIDDLGIKNHLNNWIWNPCWTYVVLKDKKDAKTIQKDLPNFVKRYFKPEMRHQVRFEMQPISNIHLYSHLENELDANGDVRYVRIFLFMSSMILIIAAINFMNLSITRSLRRAKEVIVRKAVGADRKALLRQFCVESTLLTVCAIVLAFILVEIATPYLVDLSGNSLNPNVLKWSNKALFIISSGALTGFLAGIYPAYFHASLDTDNFLQDTLQITHKRGISFRNVMVTLQFSIALFLLMTTYVIYGQFSYLQNAKLGFDKDHIVILPIANNIEVIEGYENFKKKLLQSPHIKSVTAMEEIPGTDYQTHEYKLEGQTKSSFFPSMFVRHDFIKTFNIDIVAGRDFNIKQTLSDDYVNNFDIHEDVLTYQDDDENNAVLINEAMVRHLGWKSPEDALGKEFSRKNSRERVVGVVKDFHFSSLHSKVTPFVIDLADGISKQVLIRYVAVKVEKHKVEPALTSIQTVWNKFNPKQPLDYFFLKDNLTKLYEKEKRLGQVSAWFAIIAILTACLGLFGLSAFIIERRRKEIGVRKAVGASKRQIVFFLLKKYLLLASAAIVLASPLSYMMLQNWLKQFAYHIDFPLDAFIIPALGLVLVTLLTVSFHTIKAAFAEPAHSMQSI